MISTSNYKNKLFKNGSSKIYERPPLKGYGLIDVSNCNRCFKL